MATIIHAKDLRRGHTFLYKNNLYQVLDNSFNKTAMREGIVKCKVKNLRTGSITIEVLTGEKLEQAPVNRTKAVFSYIDGENYVFMDTETYEQIEFPAKKLEWEKNFIVEGTEVSILLHNDEILNIELPDQVVMEIEYAEEGIQGSTVQTALKKARLTTGFEIEVSQFIKTGEKVLVDTADGKCLGRAK